MGTQFKKLMENMASELGYTDVHRVGSGHLEAVHPNGAKVRLPMTPRNEWRESRNSRAALERAAGRKLPRSQSGKKRTNTGPRQAGLTQTRETFRSVKTMRRDEIISQLTELDDKIRAAIQDDTEDGYRNSKMLLTLRESVARQATAQGIRVREFRL